MQFTYILPAIILGLLLTTSNVSSLQNIRIQVNNENFQSPPYLLDAIKQVETKEQRATADATATATSLNGAIAEQPEAIDEPRTSLAASAKADDDRDQSDVIKPASGSRNSSQGGALVMSNNLSVIKEETIEEMLDLEPESVLRLSPESFLNQPSSLIVTKVPARREPTQTQAQVAEPQEPSIVPEAREEGDDFFNNRPNKQFQLPVTGSHLKRPSHVLASDDDSGSSSATNMQTNSRQLEQSQQQQAEGPGAKSRVSPSVASEELADGAVNLEKKKFAPSPPDTWEPSQVMAGVVNASSVPATLKRQYGHQTRTRITLGGGYQRDKQPPLVNPSSSAYEDNKPEKPLVPLERPVRHHQPSGSAVENSRVIEVPERIVLPASVFRQQARANATETPHTQMQSIVRRRDSRCPSNGVTSLEHPAACDKYYLCEDGHSSERTCPNGLMYGTRDIVRDYCVHRWQAVCGDKSVPNPISSPGCRWQNGIFNVQGSPKCTPDFYECSDGQFEVKKCTISGQVYDDKTKSCQFAEQVGCAEEALADFKCPTDDQANTYWPFPRYFLNERALIHCVSDKPQIIRCRDHERVDPEHLFCVPIDKSAGPAIEDSDYKPEEVPSARRLTVATNQREKSKRKLTVENSNQ